VAIPSSQVIKTPDQRLRVFVSSTIRELAEERAAVSKAISKLHLTPILFELGARPHPPRDLYRSYLAQSHIFVGIYGASYGWIAPGEEISGLEDEYRLAEGLPKLIYVKQVPEREPKLAALLSEARDDGKVSYRAYETPDQLAAIVENDLAVLLTERFEEGRRSRAQPAIEEQPAQPAPLLPIQPTPFVGREREVKEVLSLLERDDVRLLTLHGPGGIGKSRLAFEVATLVQERYEDGLRFALLESITDPNLTFTAVGKAVGVAESTQRSILQNLKEFLHNKEMLLLLDNFEHVLDVAPSLADLLASCPKVNLIVTSRAALRIRDEHEYGVPPLEFPPEEERLSASDVASSEAVRLFVGRAQAAKPGFVLTDDNAATIAQIVARLDGLPLAIELAAARSRLLTPEAMLARLNKSLELLTHGPLDLPTRQRTLRAALDWDYDLLSPEEQAVFRRLSVFAGSFTIGAAEAVVAGDDDYDLLDIFDSLINKSLLQNVQPVHTDPRFNLLRTIREYAHEKLMATEEHDRVLRRHADYYLARAERAVPGLRAPDQVYWLRVLERDHDNLRAALRWASTYPDGSEMELKICAALARFWEYRGYLSEGQRWLEGALSRSQGAPRELRADCLDGAGILARGQGELKRAVQLLEECLQLRREIGDLAALAETLRNLGNAWLDRGDPVRARPFVEESLELHRAAANERGVASALNNLGVLAVHELDWAGATDFYEQALEYFERLDDKQGIARCRMNLGEAAMEQGDFATAADHLKNSYALFQELSARWDIAYLLEEMAYVSHATGRSADAARLYGTAEVQRELLGAPLSSFEKKVIQQHIDEVRAALGQEALEREWAIGRDLEVGAAVEQLFP
jgi:predicted ATPase